MHQNHLFRASPTSHVTAEWLSLFTNSPVGRAYFLTAAKQTTNLASLNMTQLRDCPTPVPSLEEQRRIVAKVGGLWSLCDELEALLAGRGRDGKALTQSVVESLVA